MDLEEVSSQIQPGLRDRIPFSGLTATSDGEMRRLALVTSLLLALLPGSVRAQLKPDSGGFVVLLGTDTIGLERYVRSTTRMQIEGVARVPQTRIMRIAIDWDAAFRLARFEIVNTGVPGAGGQATVRTTATARGDSIQIDVTEMGNTRPRVMPTGGIVPFVNPFYSTFEPALQHARAERATSVTLLNQNGPLTYDLSWSGNIAVLRNHSAGTLRVTMDDNGRMLALSGAGTTFKVEVKRIAPPDIAAAATHFVKRDAGGTGLGTLSPRDTARAIISGAVMLIDYGRPATRGRVVFGEVVPWNEVWRTGANAATQFELTRDILINGVAVPSGKYSLWTIPARGRWQLIVNKQTGQWGTAYDSTQDLARIPVTTEIVNDPVERFTVRIDPTSTGGLIRMAWDRTQVRIPFTVR
jgi:hypothetical protein